MEKQDGGGGENQQKEKAKVVLGKNRETFLLLNGSREKNPADDNMETSGSRNNRSYGLRLLQNGELCEHSHLSVVDSEYPAGMCCEHFLVEAGLFKVRYSNITFERTGMYMRTLYLYLRS